MSRLAEIRKKKGLSQNDLSRRSQVIRSLVTKYESGEKNINRAAGETLLKLATCLSCKIEDLIEEEAQIIKNVLVNIYFEWRKGIPESIDCNKESIRKDFSDYARLEETISFEEILDLEKQWESQ